MSRYQLFDPKFGELIKSEYPDLDCYDNFFKFVSEVRDVIWRRWSLPKYSYIPHNSVTFGFNHGVGEDTEISIRIKDILDESIFRKDHYEFEIIIDPYERNVSVFITKGVATENTSIVTMDLKNYLYESADNTSVHGRFFEIIGSQLDWFLDLMLNGSIDAVVAPAIPKYIDHIICPDGVTNTVWNKHDFIIRRLIAQEPLEIFVDDLRNPTFPEIGVRTVESAIELIKLRCLLANKEYTLSLDHDMGDMAGYGGDCVEVLNWLEREIIGSGSNRTITMPNEIFYHTANPVGRTNMKRIEESIYRRIKEMNSQSE